MAKTGKYSLKERLNIEELYNTFLGMAPREQILSVVGIGVVLLLLIVIPIACASSKLGKMQKQIDTNEKNVGKVMTRIAEYKTAQNRIKQVETKVRPKSEVQLQTRLESLATQSGISDKIDSLKERPVTPGEDFEELAVDVRMSRLSLGQVIEFLFGVESQQDLNLKINQLQLRPRYDNRQLFDVNFSVSTMVAVQSAEGPGKP